MNGLIAAMYGPAHPAPAVQAPASSLAWIAWPAAVVLVVVFAAALAAARR